ncbi:uncharacterized protein LOC129602723 isoform X2 [Paramacrobiotus metropolitanus]|uniref:uncharacterized protein LOC129602723 isoform X2 n=1 Tax=Paramacrobiotus metropolitanus TaxID=2943436 RepID=UPI00244638E9|nr:uncharacterized protein LOC129602723 isoform X2 [Paramacrobiotus metropolitanus]
MCCRTFLPLLRIVYESASSRDTQCVRLSLCTSLPRRTYASAVRLAEVGKFEEPKEQNLKYPTGQLFLHRIFGYRGVVLFPWLARVFDRDLAGRKEGIKIDPAQNEGAAFNNIGTGRDVKGRAVPYYQVLIDARDCPHIRAQSETVTFLGHQESSRSLYSIPGYPSPLSIPVRRLHATPQTRSAGQHRERVAVAGVWKPRTFSKPSSVITQPTDFIGFLTKYITFRACISTTWMIFQRQRECLLTIQTHFKPSLTGSLAGQKGKFSWLIPRESANRPPLSSLR